VANGSNISQMLLVLILMPNRRVRVSQGIGKCDGEPSVLRRSNHGRKVGGDHGSGVDVDFPLPFPYRLPFPSTPVSPIPFSTPCVSLKYIRATTHASTLRN